MTLTERFLINLEKVRMYQDLFMFTNVGRKVRNCLAYIGHKRIQEAHMILPDELVNVPVGSVVWVDCRDSSGELFECMPMVFCGIVPGIEQGKGVTAHIDLGNGDKYPVSAYGVGEYIYWDSRPTDEQREATPWKT